MFEIYAKNENNNDFTRNSIFCKDLTKTDEIEQSFET